MISAERLVWEPAERREAVLGVIRGARRHLVLSVFRCDDFGILSALEEAAQRGVRIRALLTHSAKNWERRLQDLANYLTGIGAEVHRYAGVETKYHAKYIVADDGPALIASLNFTRKCFRKTCDFIVITYRPGTVAALTQLFNTDSVAPGETLRAGLDDGLIVGPEQARERFRSLIGAAQRSIRIIDHRLTDAAFVGLLREREKAGIPVQVLGSEDIAGLESHGKMMLLDDTTAVIGSISLSRAALDQRRELAVTIREPANVERLRQFFETHSLGAAGWNVPERLVDDDDEAD